jgi:hypothetical protein
VPPRKTIATTRARKLPETLTLESVGTAVRSLKTEKARRTAKRPRSQFDSLASQIATATVNARAPTMTAIARRLGRVGVILLGGT